MEAVLDKASEIVGKMPLSSVDVSQVNSQSQSMAFLPTINVSSPGAGSDASATTRAQADAMYNDTPFMSPGLRSLGSVPGAPDSPASDMDLGSLNLTWLIVAAGGVAVFFIFKGKKK